MIESSSSTAPVKHYLVKGQDYHALRFCHKQKIYSEVEIQIVCITLHVENNRDNRGSQYRRTELYCTGRERYSGNTPIAMLMVGAHDPKRGEERNSIPVLVKFSKKDNWIVRQLKHAVRDMTHYETKKRPAMMKIKQNLEAVIKDMVKQPLEEEEQQFYYEDDPM
ncbi:hypothetical protein CAPTEDRAFT_207502 [Capitella teleta]|uniref:Uncharacterized protein n=1 Tax=Capitella teleta TaxID=283909 RepID=R7U9Z3_CAPTE|nr:hypothetical protein CAPTEDRAFT_207502 [Capitella teleta]|eukprot:ELU00638.1 hypothetical protein CAPTEDRAFT_207502 [Capitella teleta]